MDNFQATHFIEQYNALDDFKAVAGLKDYRFTGVRRIADLRPSLNYTSTMIAFRSVAIFKIMLKKKDHGKN